MLQTTYHPQELAYTGHQLRSHWIFETFGLQGDAIVAFRGPCSVGLSEMVDRADVAAGEAIEAAEMLHFVAEHFERDLNRAVVRQRLFICTIIEHLQRMSVIPALRRDGDDIYADGRKLSVSIATLSPVSTLMHVGLNIDPTGAPVAACGLGEWKVEIEAFAREMLASWAEEIENIHLATCKVRGVQ